MAYYYEQPDDIVCPPQPKVSDPYREMMESYEAEMRKQGEAEAKKAADYQRSSREFKISVSSAVGGESYEGEE